MLFVDAVGAVSSAAVGSPLRVALACFLSTLLADVVISYVSMVSYRNTTFELSAEAPANAVDGVLGPSNCSGGLASRMRRLGRVLLSTNETPASGTALLQWTNSSALEIGLEVNLCSGSASAALAAGLVNSSGAVGGRVLVTSAGPNLVPFLVSLADALGAAPSSLRALWIAPSASMSPLPSFAPTRTSSAAATYGILGGSSTPATSTTAALAFILGAAGLAGLLVLVALACFCFCWIRGRRAKAQEQRDASATVTVAGRSSHAAGGRSPRRSQRGVPGNAVRGGGARSSSEREFDAFVASFAERVNPMHAQRGPAETRASMIAPKAQTARAASTHSIQAEGTSRAPVAATEAATPSRSPDASHLRSYANRAAASSRNAPSSAGVPVPRGRGVTRRVTIRLQGPTASKSSRVSQSSADAGARSNGDGAVRTAANPLHALHNATATAAVPAKASSFMPPPLQLEGISNHSVVVQMPVFRHTSPGSVRSESRASVGGSRASSGGDSELGERDSPVSTSALVTAAVLGSLAAAVRRRAGSSGRISPRRQGDDAVSENNASSSAVGAPLSTLSPLHSARSPALTARGGGPPSPSSDPARRREAARARAAAAAERIQLQSAPLGSPDGFRGASAPDGPPGGLLDLLRSKGILAPGVIETVRRSGRGSGGGPAGPPGELAVSAGHTTSRVARVSGVSSLGHHSEASDASSSPRRLSPSHRQQQQDEEEGDAAWEGAPVAAATRARASSLQRALFPGLQQQLLLQQGSLTGPPSPVHSPTSANIAATASAGLRPSGGPSLPPVPTPMEALASSELRRSVKTATQRGS